LQFLLHLRLHLLLKEQSLAITRFGRQTAEKDHHGAEEEKPEKGEARQ